MTPEHETKQAQLTKLIEDCIAKHTTAELALGWLRYEALRRVKPHEYVILHKRNLAGERFDDIVTEELLDWKCGDR